MNCFGQKEKKEEAVIQCRPHELYKENLRMKEQISSLEEGNDGKKGLEIPSSVGFYNYNSFKVWRKYARWVLVGLFIVAAVFLSYFIWSGVKFDERKNIKVDQSAYHMHLSAAANDIRQCRKEKSASTDLRKTFPDIDYAMLGYDIIKGYPDSNSHDPGFTYPIFISDYSNDRLTSDCRYSIPKGFVVIPDVSCVTSFTSTVIRNSLELQKSLGVSVQASGGFGAFSFSASSSYKKTSSEVSTGEKVFITSAAKCSYYFSQLDTTQPPPLYPGFLLSAKTLQKNLSDEALVEFVKYYGTHFPTSIVFGARYIRKHSMTTDSFKKASSEDISVAAQASYSGLFSASGGFSMDKKQREAASKFSQSVETTTVSVGASPPSNGDALYWAASVKENPVPISYKLMPIANLFTPLFMKGTGINYNLIRWKLNGIEKKYCNQLLSEGTVNTCDDTIPIGLRIANHVLDEAKHPFKLRVSESSCISKCFDDQYCVSVSYFPKGSTCTFHDGETELRLVAGSAKNNPRVFIFPSRIKDLKTDLEVRYLEIGDKARDSSKTVNDKDACLDACVKDSACDVFSFDQTLTRTSNCKLYASKSVEHFQVSTSKDMVTVFIYREQRNSTRNARG